MSEERVPVIEKDMGVVSRFREGMRGLSDEDLGVMAMRSPAVHFASCVRIQNKDNEPIQPVPNILQLRMSEVYEVCMEMGVPCRMIVCKPRQVGCSTFGSHIVYHHGMRWTTAGITISDVSKNSQKLMMKVRDYATVDRFPWRIKMSRDASGELGWTNGTRWEIDSAENWKAGIGDTRQAFHASEVGKWPKTGVKNDKRVMSAVLPSISKGRSVVIAESTPAGAGGDDFDRDGRDGIGGTQRWQQAHGHHQHQATARRGRPPEGGQDLESSRAKRNIHRNCVHRLVRLPVSHCSWIITPGSGSGTFRSICGMRRAA